MLFLPRRKIFSNKIYLTIHAVRGEHEGFRVDRFLQEKYPGFSRAKVHKIIKQERIRIDRSGIKLDQKLNWKNQASDQNTELTINTALDLPSLRASSKVHHGDEVVVLTRPDEKQEIAPTSNPELIYQDEDILILNKPPMMTVHPTGGSLFHSVLQIAEELFPSKHGLYLCHRLDFETSGLIALARNKEMAGILSKSFSRNDDSSPKKKYIAISHGISEEKEFIVNKPLGKATSSEIALKMGVLSISEGGLESKTKFTVKETISPTEKYPLGFSVFECELFTGRQHQIRVHLDSKGYPLVGDKLYGNKEFVTDELFFSTRDNPPTKEQMEHLLHQRHALHAYSLELTIPNKNSTKLFLRAPLQNDLSDLLMRLRIGSP
jgi:RluA family pseudouridine synthase